VTHQGSPAPEADDSLRPSPERGSERSVATTIGTICAFCARVCSAFLRLGFIRRRNARRNPCPC
jgi:hypothetical protein